MDSLVSRRCLHHGEEVSPYHLAGMQWPGSAALPAGHPRRGSRSRGGSRRASRTDLSMTSLELSPVKWPHGSKRISASEIRDVVSVPTGVTSTAPWGGEMPQCLH
jgi:Protein of unknown function (DUF3984)